MYEDISMYLLTFLQPDKKLVMGTLSKTNYPGTCPKTSVLQIGLNFSHIGNLDSGGGGGEIFTKEVGGF